MASIGRKNNKFNISSKDLKKTILDANNNLKTNESIPLNISDLSDSSNQNIFNITFHIIF